MKADVIDACGEVASSIPDDPVLALCTWFVEGYTGPREQIDVERLYMEGAITLETRVWSCAEPGWRKLDDVWSFHNPPRLMNRAAPDDPWKHESLEHFPTLRGWLARRGARLRALRLRWFAPVVYRNGYRLAIAYYQEAIFVQVSPQRQQTARRWWRRAGFPLGGLTHGLTPEEKVRFEAADRALRYPGWLRAKLAGVITFEPTPWVRLWELAPALLLERQPAPMTRIWVPPGVPHRLARH